MKSLTLSIDNKQLLQVVLESVPTGMTVSEIRKSIKLLDLLKQESATIEIENSEFEFLYTKFNTTKFSQIHPEIVEVADILEAAIK